jgi:hypothetical protein
MKRNQAPVQDAAEPIMTATPTNLISLQLAIPQPQSSMTTNNHTVSESKSGDDVHNGDALHDSRLSDTSSISEDLSVPGNHSEGGWWDPDTGFWENFSDNKAWSDSDVATDDMQTSRQSTVPQPCVQVPPVKEQKHPRPKYNDRCRRWLWGECNLGYMCKFVHEDLEYDDPPVSF